MTEPTPDEPRRPWSRWGVRALDALVAPLAYAAVVAWMFREVAGQLGRRTFGGVLVNPGDFAGTVWFHEWFYRVVTEGEPLLWTVRNCAPVGDSLGNSFPNRVDAWFALPFVHLFSMPERYDLTVLGMFVANAWAGYFALTAVHRSRLFAWVGGLFFGISVYATMEVQGGRPVTALVAPLALAAGAWLRALERPGRAGWGWTLLAGAALTLTGLWYVPALPLLGPLLGGVALLRLVRPAEGVSRGAVLARVGAAAVLGVFLLGPWLHEVLVLRPTLVARKDAPTSEVASPDLDPRLWIDLVRRATADEPLLPTRTKPQSVPGGDAPYWFPVQREAFAWDYLWNPDPARSERWGFVAGTFLLAAALLAPLGRGRGLAALALAGVYWSITLGPNLTERSTTREVRLELVDGYRIGLPTAWLLQAAPGIERNVRPYRASPLFLLCLSGALVAGLGGLWGQGTAPGGPRGVWIHRGRRALAVGGAAWVAGRGLVETRALPVFLPWVQEWEVPAFVDELAAMPEDFAIAELPAGAGQALGAYQSVHHKRRSEPIVDLLLMDRLRPPPANCYRMPFLEALWWIGADHPDAGPAVERGLSPPEIAAARAEGFRYVLLYPELYAWGARQGDRRAPSDVALRLDAALGPAIHREPALWVWELPADGRPAPSPTPGTAPG